MRRARVDIQEAQFGSIGHDPILELGRLGKSLVETPHKRRHVLTSNSLHTTEGSIRKT